MFQYHFDRISKLPEKATVLAESELCGIQAIQYEGLPIRSVQFHPEINAQEGTVVFESLKDKLEARGYNVDLLIQQSNSVSEDARLKFFTNFLRLLT
jgi:GMP synthase-like glutamine amidotransferase